MKPETNETTALMNQSVEDNFKISINSYPAVTPIVTAEGNKGMYYQ